MKTKEDIKACYECEFCEKLSDHNELCEAKRLLKVKEKHEIHQSKNN